MQRLPLRSALLALAITALPAIARAQGPTLRVDLGEGVAIDLVLVPAGTFTAGSPLDEPGRAPDEHPHPVSIDRPFYIGKHPVTVGQFSRFVARSGYRTEAERGASGGSGWDGRALTQKKEFTWKNPGFPQTDDHPVTLVTHDDAVVFTSWLTREHRRAFSLPSEAEWEMAYRAGEQRAYHTAGEPLSLGWFKQNAGDGTRPVGQKKANALGLFDMAGNVNEWCSDWYAPYPGAPAVEPPADKPRRVLRGGSWLRDVKHGRAAARYRNTPGSRNADNGFRVVAAVTAEPPVEPARSPAGVRDPSPPQDPSTKGGLTMMGIMAVGAVGVVIIALIMLRGGKLALIRFRVAPDGFWIHAPKLLAGSTLHYRHRAITGRGEGQVILEPSDVGQFVYTGAPPGSVEAVRLVPPDTEARGSAASSSASSGAGPRWSSSSSSSSSSSASSSVVPLIHGHDPPHQSDDRRDDEPFRGYPSAY